MSRDQHDTTRIDTESREDHDGPASAFFGRRKGKRLRAGQEARLATLLPERLLPDPRAERAAYADPRAFFPHRSERLVLEIGFGGGEHLAHMARSEPGTGFVGVEPFVNGMAKMLAAIDEEDLANVRLFDQDAALLLPALPDASLDAVYLLYPDPWPKRRTRKRRFVSPETLREIARVLKPGGVFRFASDIDDYVGWTLVRAAAEPRLAWLAQRAEDWRTPYPGWPGTRYEAKAVREGRVPSYLTFERVSG
ncbi:tRNA (guanosine(46)-N7)-methyltransferase TrmB [Salinarimonas ramus]|uniref:tRNA (guanine-N(7)-)-methyltransferase n=1 Tax=Salinarimonas ramus TaxID=690164 RepID=A0A917Q702_9HYPH|nr:tRNA (guanosine(46)-N7)-methyltransferase TrmB [Salinarimonas ramus]GGK32083.1 tRNA (guanine-N(7)-)-methyltransferase [Salinarimonas ramus]